MLWYKEAFSWIEIRASPKRTNFFLNRIAACTLFGFPVNFRIISHIQNVLPFFYSSPRSRMSFHSFLWWFVHGPEILYPDNHSLGLFDWAVKRPCLKAYSWSRSLENEMYRTSSFPSSFVFWRQNSWSRHRKLIWSKICRLLRGKVIRQSKIGTKVSHRLKT